MTCAEVHVRKWNRSAHARNFQNVFSVFVDSDMLSDIILISSDSDSESSDSIISIRLLAHGFIGSPSLSTDSSADESSENSVDINTDDSASTVDSDDSDLDPDYVIPLTDDAKNRMRAWRDHINRYYMYSGDKPALRKDQQLHRTRSSAPGFDRQRDHMPNM